jgi:very-short-patch-repair endonuclease
MSKIEFVCANCKCKFINWKSNLNRKGKNFFCSRNCYFEFRFGHKPVGKVGFVCANCGKLYYHYNSFKRNYKVNYCSKECMVDYSRTHREEFMGENNHFFGKKHTAESKLKQSLIKIGKEQSVEWRLKNSLATKGEKNHNYGKKCPDWQKALISKANTGLKRSDEFKINLSIKNTGKIRTPEQRKHYSEGGKKRPKPSEETKKKIRMKRLNQIIPIKDTSIEIKIQNYLKMLDVEFVKHKIIMIEHSYQCDIFVPSLNLVIECDGDYFHNYPFGKELDHVRNKELVDAGFKVLRLWENEIKSISIDEFKEKLFFNNNI